MRTTTALELILSLKCQRCERDGIQQIIIDTPPGVYPAPEHYFCEWCYWEIPRDKFAGAKCDLPSEAK